MHDEKELDDSGVLVPLTSSSTTDDIGLTSGPGDLPSQALTEVPACSRDTVCGTEDLKGVLTSHRDNKGRFIKRPHKNEVKIGDDVQDFLASRAQISQPTVVLTRIQRLEGAIAKEVAESHVESDSEQQAMDLDLESVTTSVDLTGRKRARSRMPMTDSGSDAETEERRRKVVTPKHGVRSASSYRKELCSLEQMAKEDEEEKILARRAFKKQKPKDQTAVDPNSLNLDELREEFLVQKKKILKVSTSSGNLKGTYVKALKDAASDIEEMFNVLVSNHSEEEETRRLKRDNALLRREVDSLKADLAAHRREFATLKATIASTQRPPLSTPPRDNEDLVEEIGRSVMSSVGAFINARFEGIEERLLPATVLRPPLAADQRRAQTAKAPAAQSPKVPTDKAANLPQAKPSRNSVPAELARPVTQTRPGPPSTAPTTPGPVAGPSHHLYAVDENGFTTVVRRRRKKKTKKTGTPTETPGKPAEQKAKNKKARKPKLAAPKTAVVVLKLLPEAAAAGVTYATVLSKATERIDIKELDIPSVGFRESITGGRILELPKNSTPEMADKLAGKIRELLGSVVNVVCPTKRVELRVMGLDDSVNTNKVETAVAEAGGCKPDQLRVRDIRIGPGGVGATTVSCPVAAAKKIIEAGRLLVGWSSARVKLLDQRPLRCYRCMELGHTRPMCPSDKDRASMCFRCGKEGHRAAGCKYPPSCAICTDRGRPSGHVMGGNSCRPPPKKGKATPRTGAAGTRESQIAPEDVVMTDGQ